MKNPSLNAALLGALALGTAAPLTGQQSPPPPLPLEEVSFPPHVERTLDNGARVIIVENHEQPVVNVSIRVKNGDASDPPGKTGVASFTASLLDNGTTHRSALELAEASDFVGATLGASSSNDWSSVNLGTITPFLDQGLDLLADILLNPTFPEDELETERRRTLSGLQVELSDPNALASRRFFGEVYGEHPYGRMPTPESVREITRQDLVDFHRTYYRPDNALVVVAGDVEADDVVARLNQRLGGWTPGLPPTRTYPQPPAREGRTLYFVHKPGSVQGVIRVGHLLPTATGADWVAIDVANQVLGGGTTGWLFKILRGEKGYTYGSSSGAVERIGPGYFQATAEVRNEVADSAMAELLALLDRLRQGDIPEADLEAAKSQLAGSFPLSIETPQQVAGQLASALLLGRGAAWLDAYRGRVSATTVADVREAAREHFHPERAVMVAVGDAGAILDRLRPFADRVELFDAEGAPLAMEDLTPRASTRTYATENLEEGTSVFGITFQGNEVGEMTLTVARDSVDGAPALRFTQAVSTPGGSQESSVAVDPGTLRPLAGGMSGSMGPSLELSFDGWQVSGILSMPGGQSVPVDADLPEGTLLSPAEGPLLSVTDLSEPSFEVPMFAPGQGVFTVKITMGGEESVTVPAGTFEAYRLQMAGPQPGTLWVRKQYPHILLKQEMAAQPVSFELKEQR